VTMILNHRSEASRLLPYCLATWPIVQLSQYNKNII